MKTYYIESNGVLQNYYNTLKEAKYDLVKMFKPNDNTFIMCIEGQYKYEGRHCYKVFYKLKNNKPIFQRVKLS